MGKKQRKWRLANPKNRNESRKRNYSLSRKYAKRRKKRWTETEIEMILDPTGPLDRILSQRLKRSVQAIQIKRADVRAEIGRTRHRQKPPA